MCSGSQQWRTTRHDSEEPQHHLTQLHSSQAPQPVSMICSAAWYYPLTHAASTNPDGRTSSLMSWIDIYITARWHIATGRYSHAVVAFVVAGSRRWRRAAMQTWTSVLDDALRAKETAAHLRVKTRWKHVVFIYFYMYNDFLQAGEHLSSVWRLLASQRNERRRCGSVGANASLPLARSKHNRWTVE